MKMKKVMAGLLAGLMAFSMVACGNKSASAEKQMQRTPTMMESLLSVLIRISRLLDM